MFDINRPVHCMNAVPANWRGRRQRAGPRARAPIRRQTKNPLQYQTFAAPALFPGIEPGGKYLTFSQTELSEQPDIRNLRRYRNAWNALMAAPDRIGSIAQRDWTKTVAP